MGIFNNGTSGNDDNEKLRVKNKKLKRKIKNLKKESSKKDYIIKSLIENNGEYDNDMINYCPLCGKITKFEPFGINPRDNAFCSNCESLERHRFFYLAIEKKFPDLFTKNSRMLHFAPEKPLYDRFSSIETVEYHTADINPESYEKRGIHITKGMDMQNIEYDDESFDIIYNSHVLEHVPDDLRAMRELSRVLKSDGVCFVAVPLYDIAETLEDSKYNTPELRLKHYGQEDHLRKYGNDFADRLVSAGFSVEEITPEELVGNPFKRGLYGIGGGKLFICTRE